MTTTIMTVPETITDTTKFYPVSNEWVALPEITGDGGIHSLNVLSESHKGMLEVGGDKNDPLLKPFIKVNGEPINIGAASWSRLEDWIPTFKVSSNETIMSGTIFCPNDQRGFVYLLDITNTGVQTNEYELGWLGNWQNTLFTVYHSRESTGANIGWYNRWTRSLTFEHRCGLPALGWALGLSEPLSDIKWHINHLQSEEETRKVSGERVNFQVSKKIRLDPEMSYQLALFVAVNSEADGASTCLIDLQRHGWEKLLLDHRQWLEAHRIISENNTHIAQICNLNGFFNYFFARGKCLDTEKLVLMTTRSPRYYVSAAFWARDAYLWSLPGLLLVDPEAAREALWAGSTVYWEHLSKHSLYIDGTELYPGFELDELCSWVIGLDQYLQVTEDWRLVEAIGLGLFDNFLVSLEQWQGDNGLFKTFLSPTDDPVRFPYLTYNNALVWRSLIIVADVYRYFGDIRRAEEIRRKAIELRNCIEENCIVRGPLGPMYAWAINESGEFELLDQPPGSLQLLEYYRYCSAQDEAFKNTVAWIHSSTNPHYYCDGLFQAPYCEHSPFPWVLSLCYELINGNHQHALELLSQAGLDNGIACETIDPLTGWVKTGAAFATCAGFLAHSLFVAIRRYGGVDFSRK